MYKSELYLVGAGPGDPELITLKAIRVLGMADVILYDALANEALLEHTRPGAIRQFVGKRFGCHTLSQVAINELIVEYGQRYRHIVRLKGGIRQCLVACRRKWRRRRLPGCVCRLCRVYRVRLRCRRRN